MTVGARTPVHVTVWRPTLALLTAVSVVLALLWLLGPTGSAGGSPAISGRVVVPPPATGTTPDGATASTPVGARCDGGGAVDPVCVRWSVSVANGTFADGIVDDDRVIVLDPVAGVLMGVDSTSGRLLWLHGVSSAARLGTVAGDVAVVVDPALGLLAHDRETGDRRWRVGWPGERPVLGGAGDTIYLSGSGELVALEASDGAVRWQRRLDGAMPWVLADGVWLRGDGSLVAVDERTGGDRWRAPVSGRYGVADPSGPLIVTGDAEGRIVAVDDATGGHRWTSEPLVTAFVNGLDALDPMGAVGGTVLVRHRNELIALHPETGAVRWRQVVRGMAGSPLAAVVVPGPGGGALDPLAVPSGAERRRAPLRRATSRSVSARDQVLVLAHDPVGPPALIGLSRRTGQPSWRFDTWPARRLVPSIPQADAGQPVVVIVPGAVVALDVAN